MKKSGFTLVELMIAVAIITFLITGLINIDFRSINDKEKLDIFSLKIIGEMETVRTNSLVGKGLGQDKDIPKSWKIEFNNTSSGTIKTSYNTGSWVEYNSIFFDNFLEIENIYCSKINDTDLSDNSISGTGTIVFTGDKIKLEDDCINNQLLKVKLKHKNFNKEINFNTVNGLIQTK